MKKARLFGAVSVIIVSTLFSAPSSVLAVTLDDGGTYTINSAITDGLNITNGTTVTLETGADISGAATYGTIYNNNYTGVLNINDGLVQGEVQSYGSVLNIVGGTIEGPVTLYGGSTATISGGTIDSIFSEGASLVDISGGIFGGINTISGSYNITGGTFLGLLEVTYDLSATMDIKGGNFTGGFSYDQVGGLEGTQNFIFFGDLSLTTPTLISGSTYETIISGTLMDDSAISQSIMCNDVVGEDPCSHITIVNTVPIPPSVWLFGPGLLGLVGIARRKKA